MTLSTHIRIVDPLSPETVFEFCQSLLGDPTTMKWTHEEGYSPGTMMYANKGGQGFAAWLSVTYHPDGPLPRDDGDDEPDDRPLACIDIDLDTTYGYQAKNGAGCGDLHAWLITQVVDWLGDNRARTIKYFWQNEFTGEWFDNLYDLPQLGDARKGAL